MHGILLSNMIRSLILSSSKCDKINLIYVYLLMKTECDSITLEQLQYKLLKRIISDISSIKMYTFFEIYTVISLEKVLPNYLFIMNDVIRKNKCIIRDYFI